jgi:hypothetical protein
MANNTRRQWLQEHNAVLDVSTSPEELEIAGSELASSDDPEALDAWESFCAAAIFWTGLIRLTIPPGEPPICKAYSRHSSIVRARK